MIQIPEYDLSNEDSLTVLREADVVSQTEAEKFRAALKRIGGTTLTGQPRLQMVWGPTYTDPMSTNGESIKYLDFEHRGVQLGERRFFIEIHRSAEFLAQSGRYQITTRQDELTGEKLLKSLPSEGCYDYWLRLERANLTYHPPDMEALKVIEALWDWERNPDNRRDALEQADRELQRRQELQVLRQQIPTNLHFGSGLILPHVKGVL